MKYKYEDFDTLEQVRDELIKVAKNYNIDLSNYIEDCNKELLNHNERIFDCKTLIKQIVEILNNVYTKYNIKCPLCNEENFYCEKYNETYIYKCKDCAFIGFELIDRQNEKDMADYLKQSSNKKPLWVLYKEYQEELEYRTNEILYNKMTIKELLDLGFNNNYLSTEEKHIELGWKEENGSYSNELTKEQLNVIIEIKMTEDYKKDYSCYDDDDIFTDMDGYKVMEVICVNKNDEKLFKEMN